MIVVTLTYKKPLTEVDAVLKEHIAFLDHYYSQIIIKPIQWCNELFRTF